MAKARKKDDDTIPICKNKRAYYEYEVFDTMECGIVLVGTEVKSLREHHGNLEDAYARIQDGEVWLLNADIPEYSMGNRLNHRPKRPRKLLMHRQEIEKFAEKSTEQGFTLIPLRMYFKDGRAKVEIAIARGKKLHDKRESAKKAEAQKEIRKAMSRKPGR